MNKHLNIFRTYTKETRQYQLENDLTRALAITLQEDNLFLHEFLKYVLKDTEFFSRFFNVIEGDNTIEIHIQESASSIDEFDYIVAVSLSESEMSTDKFWDQKKNKECDTICDLVVKVNNVLIIVESKRDNVNCIAQLYNQVYNICNSNNFKNEMKKIVTPVDLSWSKLMGMTIKVASFENAIGNQSRFITDFIELVKGHNFRWLPEPAIFSLSSNNKKDIERRIDSALTEACKRHNFYKLENRRGFKFSESWAQEVLFKVNGKGGLVAEIYPGNTKKQGKELFQKEPEFFKKINIGDQKYEAKVSRHIKFTSFQRYFTGLWFDNDDLKKELYTKENYNRYTGRKKREKGDWNELEKLFNDIFKSHYLWKEQCNWNEKIINSGKSQFDISFGYQVQLVIPFSTLKTIDQDKSDIEGLAKLLKQIYYSFQNSLLKQ